MQNSDFSVSTNRVVSFSLKPDDTKGRIEIDYLKDYCSKKGLNFSHLVVKAITEFNKGIRS